MSFIEFEKSATRKCWNIKNKKSGDCLAVIAWYPKRKLEFEEVRNRTLRRDFVKLQGWKK